MKRCGGSCLLRVQRELQWLYSRRGIVCKFWAKQTRQMMTSGPTTHNNVLFIQKTSQKDKQNTLSNNTTHAPVNQSHFMLMFEAKTPNIHCFKRLKYEDLMFVFVGHHNKLNIFSFQVNTTSKTLHHHSSSWEIVQRAFFHDFPTFYRQNN